MTTLQPAAENTELAAGPGTGNIPPRSWVNIIPFILNDIALNIQGVYYRRIRFPHRSALSSVQKNKASQEHWLGIRLKRHLPAGDRRALKLRLKRLLSSSPDCPVQIRIYYRNMTVKGYRMRRDEELFYMEGTCLYPTSSLNFDRDNRLRP